MSASSLCPSYLRFLAAALVAAATTSANAQTSRQVLLVVNTSSPESMEIGAYYARKRNIPAHNTCRLAMPSQETISREAYKKTIEQPILRFLRERGLSEEIYYIVTTLGVPLRIGGAEGITGDAAAVDSEMTLLYRRLHGEEPATAGAVPNPFFAREGRFRHPDYPLYLVTRLAAWDTASVKAMIDRSIYAENRGKVVLDLRSNQDDDGNRWLRRAAMLLPAGRVVLDESDRVLYDVKDVIGYASWGSNDRNRKNRLSGFHWLPGGIATEYVSTDARTFHRPPDSWNISSWSTADKPRWFAGSPQSLTADFIGEGATGASGHVYEPYLANTPRPNLLFPAYLSGRNLAESYYTAIPMLSWQNVVIGDPLCRLQ